MISGPPLNEAHINESISKRRRLIEMSTFRVYRYESTTIIVHHGATSHLKGHTRTRLRRRGLTRQVPEAKEICRGRYAPPLL